MLGPCDRLTTHRLLNGSGGGRPSPFRESLLPGVDKINARRSGCAGVRVTPHAHPRRSKNTQEEPPSSATRRPVNALHPVSAVATCNTAPGLLNRLRSERSLLRQASRRDMASNSYATAKAVRMLTAAPRTTGWRTNSHTAGKLSAVDTAAKHAVAPSHGRVWSAGKSHASPAPRPRSRFGIYDAHEDATALV